MVSTSRETFGCKREVSVREEDAAAARDEAVLSAAEAEEAVRARLLAEERAAGMRKARERCAMRDAASSTSSVPNWDVPSRA